MTVILEIIFPIFGLMLMGFAAVLLLLGVRSRRVVDRLDFTGKRYQIYVDRRIPGRQDVAVTERFAGDSFPR